MDKLLNMPAADAAIYLLWIVAGVVVMTAIILVVFVVILWRAWPALRDMPSWLEKVDAKLNNLADKTNILIVKVDDLCDKIEGLCRRVDAQCEKMETIHNSPARELTHPTE